MPLTFHLYGFIIGVATIVGLLLAEYRFLQLETFPEKKRAEQFFWQVAMVVLVTGIIGARSWHVATDWPLYQENIIGVFKIWNGGLSILGAVSGGMTGLYFFVSRQRSVIGEDRKKIFLMLLDVSVFGLPFAQAIGRLGNYVNQELYGLPTELPWGIPVNGVSAHPLWAYEALLMLLFGIGVWLRERSNTLTIGQGVTIGSGSLFLLYIFYYSFIRFWLDFLRIDKAMSSIPQLGINQLVVLGVMSIISVYMLTHLKKNIGIFILGSGLILLVVGMGSNFFSVDKNKDNVPATTAQLATLTQDRQTMKVLIGSQKISVEVVNSPASITQGLSGRSEIGHDGMLFLFGEKRIPQFWMKEMQFDLDLVWIRNNKIVGITENVPRPAPETPLDKLPHYAPPEAVDAVLEIPAGRAKEWGIKPGDPVVSTQ